MNCKISYSIGENLEFVGCDFQATEWKQTQTTKLEVNFCELDENTNVLVCNHDETLTQTLN